MFTTNTDRLRSELERRMVEGSLEPGTAIDESRLGHYYDVSRTPVREALLQLAAEGFVRIMPRSGIYVVQMSAAELAELVELLIHNEAYCVALACERMAPATIKRLGLMRRVGEQALKDGDLKEFSRFVLAIHEMIYEGAANRVLKAQILQLRKRLVPYRSQGTFTPEQWLEMAWSSYSTIIQALADRNATDAQHQLAAFVTQETRPFLDMALLDPEHLYFKTDVRAAESSVAFDMETLFVLGVPVAPRKSDTDLSRKPGAQPVGNSLPAGAGMVPA